MFNYLSLNLVNREKKANDKHGFFFSSKWLKISEEKLWMVYVVILPFYA